MTALGLLIGCATPPKPGAQDGPTAFCPVCRYNHDLACLKVRVDNATPRVDYEGTTYYFCSARCRAEFLKKPAKYLPKPSG